MLYYRAQDGITADIIPFYENGYFYLFYLHDFRDIAGRGEGTPWRLVRTKDFTQYEEMGEVLSRGTKEEQDLYVFTGSVFKEAEGKYHIFYTGHNPHLRAKGYPEQAVMHAVSQDLIHWEKRKEDTFYAPTDVYEPHDWRDPFVYFDERRGCYRMLLAARMKEGDRVKRGCTALCTSMDLKKWKVEEPLWQPKAYFTHECPDFFAADGDEYLVYSEFSDRHATRYRVSKAGEDNWMFAGEDVFDGRAFYAAKTAADAQKRYVFGWVPTKEKDIDDANWQWGGNLMVHEVFRRQDRTLGCRLPEGIRRIFTNRCFHLDETECGSRLGFAWQNLTKVNARRYFLTADMVISDENVEAGILLRHDAEEDFSYGYRFSPRCRRLSFGQVPYSPWGCANFLNVERVIRIQPGERVHLDLVVEDGVCVLYADGVALTSRMYAEKENWIGVFSENGRMRMENVEVFTN